MEEEKDMSKKGNPTIDKDATILSLRKMVTDLQKDVKHKQSMIDKRDNLLEKTVFALKMALKNLGE